MAILSKDQILQKLKAQIGDDTKDETLQFIEDVTDTFDDLDNKSKDTTNWKEKYEENDKNWRTKYRERFFKAPAKEKEKESEDDEEYDDDFSEDKNKKLYYENLFKEETK